SHGHTVFHHPESQMTAQIGDGAAIAAVTGMQVVSDFRTQDLAKGGQGAPLAPLADRYLFPGYDFYLNLGGIANISSNTGSSFVAFDIGAANQLFNALAQRAGQAFDEGGKIAASGQLLPTLLQTACQNPFYQLDYPKSLDNQWVQKEVIPLYLSTDAATADLMHTAVCQLAQLTAEAVRRIIEKEGLMPQKSYRMFSTGGGTLNNFLIQQIQSYCNEVVPLQLIVPKRSAIEFKEALLMALMGVFRIEHIPNCLSSVTGAKQSTIGGAIYQGSNQIPVYG
ncbi:MAG: anhydro-N-acetylmuramic acid kinase, partial [Bacteroidota bacterium]